MSVNCSFPVIVPFLVLFKIQGYLLSQLEIKFVAKCVQHSRQ